jgi:hypothetical protein
MQVQNQTSNSDLLNQIDQQINQSIGKTDPKMAQALEQFLAQLLGQDQSQQSPGGNNQTGGHGQTDGNDPLAKLKQDLSQGNIGNLITDAMTMLSQGALAA